MNLTPSSPCPHGLVAVPGKPLAPLHGGALLGPVYLGTGQRQAVGGRLLATCDEEILTYAHPSARIA